MTHPDDIQNALRIVEVLSDVQFIFVIALLVFIIAWELWQIIRIIKSKFKSKGGE
jgi:hypothetical protein